MKRHPTYELHTSLFQGFREWSVARSQTRGKYKEKERERGGRGRGGSFAFTPYPTLLLSLSSRRPDPESKRLEQASYVQTDTREL